MFVPDAFPDELRGVMRRLLFGTTFSPRLAVLTPIGALFDPWSDAGESSSGWWKASRLGEVLFVNSRQGSAVLDPICALDRGTSILYAGLAGSCGAHGVGEVVEVSVALSQETSVPCSWVEESPFPKVTLASVSCLAESFERREEIARVADTVDMETALVFLAAERQGKRARSVQVISDHLFDQPFYTVERASYTNGIETLRDYVSDFTRRFTTKR